MSAVPSVSVACLGRKVWIQVQGRGGFLCCPTLKKFVEAMIQRGYREFLIDLGDCEHMDSTFMGTLTGFSQRLKALKELEALESLEGSALRIINVCPRNLSLFENLGLDQLFEIEPAGPVRTVPEGGSVELLPLPCEEGVGRDVVLAAHEALVAANPENAVRFRDVLDYLKENS